MGIVGSARKLINQTLEIACQHGHLSTCVEEAITRMEVSLAGLRSHEMMTFYSTHSYILY